jgi:hypothetical protein
MSKGGGWGGVLKLYFYENKNLNIDTRPMPWPKQTIFL